MATAAVAQPAAVRCPPAVTLSVEGDPVPLDALWVFRVRADRSVANVQPRRVRGGYLYRLGTAKIGQVRISCGYEDELVPMTVTSTLHHCVFTPASPQRQAGGWCD